MPARIPAAPLEILRDQVASATETLTEYLRSNELPNPSFEAAGPKTVLPRDAPTEVLKARQELLSAALAIQHLAAGPSEFLPNLATGFQYTACLDWLCRYDIFRLVPLPTEENPANPHAASISYSKLAALANVDPYTLRAILRMAMTTYLFHEVPASKSTSEASDETDETGPRVAHSATSGLLATQPDVHAYAMYMCARSAPMAAAMSAAHRRWGTELTAAGAAAGETAYNAAFATPLPFFAHIAAEPARAAEFATYMRCVRSSSGVDLSHLVRAYAWEKVSAGGLVVDVGGSTGGAAIVLANSFPQLNFIVEDLPENAEAGAAALATGTQPEDVKKRIRFVPHDFMQPQPVAGAAIYLLRMILHDWPDATAAVILRHLVAAMKRKGGGSSPTTASRLLIMDTILPTPGTVPVAEERLARARDLTMMQAFNAKERHLEDWQAVLKQADPRLRLEKVCQPPGSIMGLLVVELDEVEEIRATH